MKTGVAIASATHADIQRDVVLRELDAWSERSRRPDVFPVWARFDVRRGEWELDVRLLESIESRGIEAPVYVESGSVPGGYRAILDGTHDDALRYLACRVGTRRLRWDQEPNGHIGFRWQSAEESPLYVPAYQHVSGTCRGESDVRMIWCIVGANIADAIASFYPGDEYVQDVGFDRFRWEDESPLPPQQWAGPARKLATLGKPLHVCESGTRATTSRRAEYVRSLASVNDVPGVEIASATLFDIRVLIPALGIDHDWTWNAPMYRAFRELGA